MDSQKYWSTTETNKFLYQQLKAMCEDNGFVLSPRKGKHFVRIAEHYVQIVCSEIIYNGMRIHVLLSPAGSFANYFYAKKLLLHTGTEKMIFTAFILILQWRNQPAINNFMKFRG